MRESTALLARLELGFIAPKQVPCSLFSSLQNSTIPQTELVRHIDSQITNTNAFISSKMALDDVKELLKLAALLDYLAEAVLTFGL